MQATRKIAVFSTATMHADNYARRQQKTGERWVPVSNGVDEWVSYGTRDKNRNCKLHSEINAPDPHPCHTHRDTTRYPDVGACNNQQTFCCDKPARPVRNGDCIFCLWLLENKLIASIDTVDNGRYDTLLTENIMTSSGLGTFLWYINMQIEVDDTSA